MNQRQGYEIGWSLAARLQHRRWDSFHMFWVYRDGVSTGRRSPARPSPLVAWAPWHQCFVLQVHRPQHQLQILRWWRHGRPIHRKPITREAFSQAILLAQLRMPTGVRCGAWSDAETDRLKENFRKPKHGATNEDEGPPKKKLCIDDGPSLLYEMQAGAPVHQRPP